MPKNGAFGYDMNHAKVNEWSREDSPLSDFGRNISFVLNLN